MFPMIQRNTLPIRAVLIDDEANARRLLKQLITASPYEIEIVGEADDVRKGCQLVNAHEPDLIFLDVQLRSGTGFDLLNCLKSFDAEVIFVTAYSEFAVQALNRAALGYILKPLRIDELHQVLARFMERQGNSSEDQRLPTLLHNRNSSRNRLVVPNVNGFRVLDPTNILYLRGEVNYTRFYLKNGTELLSSKTLKEYQKILEGNGFCRVHQSSLVNLRYVSSYQRGEGGVVCLSNGDHIDVSRRRKADFVRCFMA